MSFLSGLPRAWVTIRIPGTATRDLVATYVGYPHDQLPGLPVELADFEWLVRAPRHPTSYMARAFGEAVRDLTPHGLTDLIESHTAVPDDLARFLRDDGLRDRLRSATDSYFDLGDTTVAIDGGHLVHLISDSQWVFHWLLYLGEDGSSAVVATGFPAGFSLDADEYAEADWLHEDGRYILVADTFAEFIWRWWMDNEIFYQAVASKAGLTAEQRAYVAQYGPPAILD
jgi:hypothetical protein